MQGVRFGCAIVYKLVRNGIRVDRLWIWLTYEMTLWKSEGVTGPPADLIGHFHASVVRLSIYFFYYITPPPPAEDSFSF